MASSITLYDEDGSPVVVSGEDMKGLGGMGVGQTWQDMTASRAYNTVYTNNTSRPIMISMNSTLTITDQALLVIGGVTVSYSRNGDITGTIYGNILGIVPVGATYEVQKVNTPTIFQWAELRGV